ncbi:unnamed protein product, partial [Allacma fusca]
MFCVSLDICGENSWFSLPLTSLVQKEQFIILLEIVNESQTSNMDLAKETYLLLVDIWCPSLKAESCRVRGRRINSSDMTENNSPLNNNKSSLGSNEASSTNPSQPGQPQRRLIKADLDLLYSFDTKDEDEDEDDLPVDSSKETETCFFGHICPEGTQSTPVTPWKKPL